MAEVEKESKLVPEDRKMPLLKLVQITEETNKRMVAVATNTQNLSTNTNKKSLLNQSLDKIEGDSPKFIDVLKRIAQNPNDQKNPDYRKLSLQYSSTISSGLNDILKATQIEDLDLYGKLNEVLDYITLLIVPAKETQQAVKILTEAIADNASPPEIEELHSIGQDLVQNLINCTNTMMQNEADPIRRAFFEQAIWEIEEQVGALDAAANAALSGENGALEVAKNMCQSVCKTATRLILGPSKAGNEDSGPVHIPTSALSNLSERVYEGSSTQGSSSITVEVPPEFDLDIDEIL